MQAAKFGSVLSIAIVVALVSGLAIGQQVYKWKDSSGVVHYAQTPPASGTQYSKVRLSSGSEVVAHPSAEVDAPSSSPSDAAKPAQQARSGEGTQQATSENRKAYCKQVTENLATLQGSGPVIAASSSGKQEVLGEDARKQQIATARANQERYCKSDGT